MSSSFGGTSGGSGNRVVYVVTVDSSGVAQGLQTAEQSFNRFNTSTQSTARNLQTINSPLQQLDTAFQGVGTNVDSASQSFNGMDNSLQTTSQSIKNTTTDLDAINGNWQQMDSGASNASNSVDALGNAFNASKGGLNEYNTLSGTVVTNTENMGDATQTMGDKMKSAGSFLKSNALSVSLVASGIVGLVSSYTQLQKAQLASERASLMKEKADQRVVKAQDALNKAIAKYGAGSHEAKVKAEDFRLAMEAQGVATQKAGLAAQTAAQATASFIPQLLQDAVFIGGGVANMTTGLKDGIPVIKGFASALKTGLAPALLAASAPILVAVVGIYALIGALRAAQKLNELVQQKTGGQAQQMSMIEALRKTLFGTPEEKKQAEEFNKQMQNNVITTKEYTDVMKDAFNPISIVDDIVGQVNTSLGKLKTTTAQTTETTDEATVSNEELAKASGIARMGIDQSATSIDAYVASVTKQIDAGDVLAKQQVDALAHIKPYTEAMLKLVDIENKGAQRIGELDKVQTQFNDTLQTTKSGVTTTADIMDAVNSTLHVTSTNILTLDKEMNDLATTRAPMLREQMVKAANDSQKAWADFATEFNKRTNIIGAMGFKFDSDKFTKEWIKMLPNKLEKKMKLDLKFTSKSKEMEQSIQDRLQEILKANPKGGFDWRFKINDKSATDIAKTFVKQIDSEFGKGGKNASPELKGLRDKLSAAIDTGASESDIEKILADAVTGAPPIPVYIVAAPGSAEDIKKSIGPVSLEAIINANSISFDNIGQSGASTAGSFNQAEGGLGKGISIPIDSVTLTPKVSNVALAGVPVGDLNLNDLIFSGGIGFSGSNSDANFGGNNSNPGSGSGSGTKFLNIPISGVTITPAKGVLDMASTIVDTATATTIIAALFSALAKSVGQSMTDISAESQVSAQVSAKAFSGMGKSVNKIFSAMSTHWNDMANNMIKAANTASNKIANAFSKMASSFNKIASAMSKHWNDMLNNMIKASKNAVGQILSQLNKLNTTVTTTHVITTVNRTRNLGTRLAKGGIISAAAGYTTNGPQLLLVGDNPGGRETIAAIPNNAPANMMQQLERKFGRGGSGSVVNQQINLHISGNDIINERNLSKRIKLTVGENRDKFG